MVVGQFRGFVDVWCRVLNAEGLISAGRCLLQRCGRTRSGNAAYFLLEAIALLCPKLPSTRGRSRSGAVQVEFLCKKEVVRAVQSSRSTLEAQAAGKLKWSLQTGAGPTCIQTRPERQCRACRTAMRCILDARLHPMTKSSTSLLHPICPSCSVGLLIHPVPLRQLI
jgi:hypothetical protein